MADNIDALRANFAMSLIRLQQAHEASQKLDVHRQEQLKLQKERFEFQQKTWEAQQDLFQTQLQKAQLELDTYRTQAEQGQQFDAALPGILTAFGQFSQSFGQDPQAASAFFGALNQSGLTGAQYGRALDLVGKIAEVTRQPQDMLLALQKQQAEAGKQVSEDVLK